MVQTFNLAGTDTALDNNGQPRYLTNNLYPTRYFPSNLDHFCIITKRRSGKGLDMYVDQLYFTDH